MVNHLAGAASEYLRLHGGNPINWWPWCDEAFAEARRLDRPVLVSVGYAACHWCHVMAAESFSDPAVAELVNASYVAIKVDREERPDVDQVLMKATQAMIGIGGWPLNVFLTPDGLPFFAGTYFPPEPTNEIASFSEVLTTIAEAWTARRVEFNESGNLVREHLVAEMATTLPARSATPVWELLTKATGDFDPINGGFGDAPKFPPTALLDALLVKGEPGSLDIAGRTLDAMARGGIHDQLGGGFHRYSTDAAWAVPHFEKMLYDNALLLGVYARGWRRVPDHEPILRWQFERVVRGIVGWMRRELLTESGGLAASLDADSADIRGTQHEGIYYLWNHELLTEALAGSAGEDDARWAADVFHVTKAGTFEHGLSTLQLRGNPDPARLEAISARLWEVRAGRFTPARDSKVVAAWNGWAIDSLVWAALIFGETEWLELAESIAESLWSSNWDGRRLHRASYKGEPGEVLGFAEDYGALALGFARLAAALGKTEWLHRARTLLEHALALFGVEDEGFFDTSNEAELLFVRPRELGDQPTPAGTSSLIAALRLVGLLTENQTLIERADLAKLTLQNALESNPQACGAALYDALLSDETRMGLRPTLVKIGSNDPLAQSARAVWRMAPAGTVATLSPHTEGIEICRWQGDCRQLPLDVELKELRQALWTRG